MSDEPDRSPERLVFFTDAVVAIAITLLVLPLIDLVPTDADPPPALGPILLDHIAQIIGFVVSFLLVGRLWYSHHELFGRVRHASVPLVTLDLVWTMTIVALPAATAFAFDYPTQSESGRLAFIVYLSVLTLSSALLSALTLYVSRDRRVAPERGPAMSRRVFGSITATSSFVLAMVIGLAFPVINYWSLFIAFLVGPVEAMAYRRRRRRRTPVRS